MRTSVLLGTLLFAIGIPLDLRAQGTFLWGNNFPFIGTTPQVRAPIYGVDPAEPTQIKRGNTSTGLPAGTRTYGGALLVGTGFTAGIYLGNDPASTMANPLAVEINGTLVFRTAGLLGTTLATTSLSGAGVHYQFRAWDNQGGTVGSWSQVMAAGGQIASGTSDVYVFNAVLDGSTRKPPFTDGIRSFQLTQVPEPSLLALGALGLGLLLLRRRR